MAKERRIKRLEQLILEVVAETLQREIRDPRVGLVSITRVQLSPDLSRAKIFWSSLEAEGARRRVEGALESALPVLQRHVAAALSTRVTPVLELRFDPTLERAQRLDEIFRHLAEERGDDPAPDEEEVEGDLQPPPG